MSHDRLPACWYIKSVQSCSGTKLHHEITGVVLEHRWQNRALLSSAVDEGADRALASEVGKLSAMAGSAVINHWRLCRGT